MMTDNELRTSWRNAEDQTKQITILAELNACSTEEIHRRLVKLGLLEDKEKDSFDFMRCAELYAEGKSDLEIAEMLGESVRKVQRWRKSKGFRANYPSTRAPARKPVKKKSSSPKPKPEPAVAPQPEEATKTDGDVLIRWRIAGCLVEITAPDLSHARKALEELDVRQDSKESE